MSPLRYSSLSFVYTTLQRKRFSCSTLNWIYVCFIKAMVSCGLWPAAHEQRSPSLMQHSRSQFSALLQRYQFEKQRSRNSHALLIAALFYGSSLACASVVLGWNPQALWVENINRVFKVITLSFAIILKFFQITFPSKKKWKTKRYYQKSLR